MTTIRREVQVEVDIDSREAGELIWGGERSGKHLVTATINPLTGDAAFADGSLPATSVANDSAAILALLGNVENKVVAKTDANTYYISVPKAGTKKSALVYEIKQGSVTATDSQGAPGEFFRVTKVTEVVRAVVATHAHAATSNAGDWTQSSFNLPGQAGNFGTGSWGTGLKYRATAVQNAWAEYSITVGESGRFTLGFRVGSGFSTSSKVSIDGVDADTFSLAAAATNIWIKEYQAAPGAHTVRITKLDAGAAALQCFGANFYDAADLPAGNSIDSWAYGRTSTYYKNASLGAIDYAMRSVGGDVWCGSFHGGETRSALSVLVDGVDISASAVGTIASGRDVIIDQTTSVDTGAGSVAITSRHRWQQSGGHAFSAIADCGEIEMTVLYTLMSVLEPGFSECVYPVPRDFSAQVTQSKDGIGPTEMVVMRNPTSGQRAATWCRQFSLAANAYGGAYLWHNPGTYTKPYNGPVIESAARPGRVAWTAIHAYF